MFGDKLKTKFRRWRQNLKRCEYWKRCNLYKENEICLNANSIFGDAELVGYCGRQRTFEDGDFKEKSGSLPGPSLPKENLAEIKNYIQAAEELIKTESWREKKPEGTRAGTEHLIL